MQASMEIIHCNQCGLPSASDAVFCQRCGAQLPASTSPPVSLHAQVHYAGFWIRFIAALIDSILVFTVLHLFTMLAGSYITISGLRNGLSAAKIFAMRRTMRILVGLFFAGLYRVGMESSEYQATLGKLAVRIKVTDLMYQRLSFTHAALRYASKLVSVLTFGIGYVMAGFNNRKQALHDKLAETFVVYR